MAEGLRITTKGKAVLITVGRASMVMTRSTRAGPTLLGIRHVVAGHPPATFVNHHDGEGVLWVSIPATGEPSQQVENSELTALGRKPQDIRAGVR